MSKSKTNNKKDHGDQTQKINSFLTPSNSKKDNKKETKKNDNQDNKKSPPTENITKKDARSHKKTANDPPSNTAATITPTKPSQLNDGKYSQKNVARNTPPKKQKPNSNETVTFATKTKSGPPPKPLYFYTTPIVFKFTFEAQRNENQLRNAELCFNVDRFLGYVRQHCEVKLKPIRPKNNNLDDISTISSAQSGKFTNQGPDISSISLYTTTEGFTQSGTWESKFPLNLSTSKRWSEIRHLISFDLSNDMTKTELAPLGEHATLASIIIPGYQNLDGEALSVNVWEKQKLQIEFKPIKFQ